MKKLLIAVSSLLLLTVCSCKQEIEEFPLHRAEPDGAEIKLPAHPDFQAIRQIPIQFDDSVYTTWGVISNQKKLLASEIRVRGTITEVSEDCPGMTKPRKSKKVGKKRIREGYKCKGLYVMIKSPESVNKSIMVVGYHPYFHPYFKVGMELDVTGQYLLEADQFVRPRDGLLYSLVVNNMAVDRRGNFTDDPVEAKIWQQRGDQAGTPKLK